MANIPTKCDLNSSSVEALSRYSSSRRASYNGPPYTLVVFAVVTNEILVLVTVVVKSDASVRNVEFVIALAEDCTTAVTVSPRRIFCPAVNSVVNKVPVPARVFAEVFETRPVSRKVLGPSRGAIVFAEVVRPSSRKRRNVVTNSTKTGYSLSAKSGIAVLMRCVKSCPLL